MWKRAAFGPSTYKLNVIDLPGGQENPRDLSLPRPGPGMKDAVEDPGGDLRAVEGTEADVAIMTDRPLANGVLLLDDGTKTAAARRRQGNAAGQRARSRRTGCITSPPSNNGEDVRLTDDYFIEATQGPSAGQ